MTPLDIHPRVLRYFLVVAEELHFRRAAERLYITSPALSQQIRQLETTLGATLFRRTSRSVELTESGAQLIPLARSVIQASDTLNRWAATDSPHRAVVCVGFMSTGAGEATQSILRAAGELLPDVDLQLRHVDWGEQSRVLIDGVVDAAFLREPVSMVDFRCTTVLSEPRVAMLPASHPLSGRSTVSFTEIADEIFLPSATGTTEWTDYWLVDPRPDGSRARRGPGISTVEEMLEHCAAGRGIATTAASVSQFYAHPGVRFVVIEDLPDNRVYLAVRADNDSPPVAAFEAVVRQTLVARQKHR
ncbi:LysR family transcriptional regulator [Gordonia sp. TBRC 11910]|uniref:LysR family transcriptional regulator n=1 Tax=Gordonia asplenii TaxID=2725283 RepID=A0A848L1K6_9ACTN|nr:LysR family transcriptional regulator [Gordonia asplenii]NMO02965.1 LysR family transcriptional regulator [Gordonia asplenii]